jgi:hypothetical protein
MTKKNELLGALAGKNRGLLANELEKVAILAAIARLEDVNPTPNPIARGDLLDGDWRLLYTTSRELLGLDRVPVFQLGQVYQCIRTDSARIYNIAEIVGVPGLEGLVSVCAQLEGVSDRRVNVKFERAILGLQRFVGYQSPGEMVAQIEAGKKFTALDFGIGNRDRQGWLDITYLDEDLRIGRGNQGSAFVLFKT